MLKMGTWRSVYFGVEASGGSRVDVPNINRDRDSPPSPLGWAGALHLSAGVREPAGELKVWAEEQEGAQAEAWKDMGAGQGGGLEG